MITKERVLELVNRQIELIPALRSSPIEAGLAMAFKLAMKAEQGWRKLNGSAKLQDVIDGIVYVDGERIAA